MIKDLNLEQLDEVMTIWLKTNVSAHGFIEQKYWEDNFEFVKLVLPTSDVKVFEEDGVIKGFIGVIDGYIAGLFVDAQYQNQGIGRQLLDYFKNELMSLHLDVYIKNEGAIAFYKQNGFNVINEKSNQDTGEMEYFMVWSK